MAQYPHSLCQLVKTLTDQEYPQASTLPHLTGQLKPLLRPSTRILARSLVDAWTSRWYFDVASTSSANETITVVFFERGPTGFLGNVTTENTLSVQVTGTMKNGTVYNIQSDASANASAVINTSDNSIYGDWETTGFRFAGTEGGTKYTISINDAEHEIFGSIIFESVRQADPLMRIFEDGSRD